MRQNAARVGLEIRLRIQVEGPGDPRAIRSAVVASGYLCDGPACVGDNGRRVAFDKSPRSQQLLYVENDDAAGVFIVIIAVIDRGTDRRRVALRHYALYRLHEKPVIRRDEDYRGAGTRTYPVYHAKFDLRRGGVRRIPD